MRAVLIVGFVVLTGTAGELCLSHAMKRIGELHEFSPRAILRFIGAAARQIYAWVGITFLALGFYGFLTMFSWYPVSFVVPAMSLSVVTGALGAKLLLREQLGVERWIGILCVCFGVALAWGDQAPAVAPAALTVIIRGAVYILAALSLFFYLFAAWAAWRFFRQARRSAGPLDERLPSVRVLKPVRGVDRSSYDNFASFCRQDYPRYEVLFAVGDASDPAVPVIRRLIGDFPGCTIRLFVGADHVGANDKVAKLCRLSAESRSELLVIADSDVRVSARYLHSVAAPFADPYVGVVTALYRTVEPPPTFGATMDAVGSLVSFSGLLLVARELEGISVSMGSTVAISRELLREIGGFAALLDLHADDYEIGRRARERGYRIELAPEVVGMDFPPQTFRGYLRHQLRWLVSIRKIRPGGHFALLLMQGIFWCAAAALISPSRTMALAWLAAYLAVRLGAGYVQFVRGLRDPLLRGKLWLVPLQDGVIFLVWLASFVVNRLEWRGLVFTIEKGRMVPVEARSERE
jgi:ceramide glucosyltransferase